MKRRIALGLSALAVVGMGGVACSPRSEKPTETPSSATATPTEKGMQSNVTRAPMSAAPAVGGGGGNPAVPCGFGPRGGGPCGNNG